MEASLSPSLRHFKTFYSVSAPFLSLSLRPVGSQDIRCIHIYVCICYCFRSTRGEFERIERHRFSGLVISVLGRYAEFRGWENNGEEKEEIFRNRFRFQDNVYEKQFLRVSTIIELIF